jgi:hypothetical protein
MQLIRSGPGRDLRVDFFRGLALWCMFVDHIPGNMVRHYTLHNWAQCDAAEVFVLLAGFAATKAYAGVMDKNGWLYGAIDAVKRAWTLYIAHIFLFVIYAAQVSWVAEVFGRPGYITEIKLNDLAQSPYHALLQALTLRYQPSMLNILPLYVVLLTMFAISMPLLRRPRLLLSLSVALYVAAGFWQFNLPGWRGTDWYLDPFSWQIVFVIGAVLAYAPPDLRAPARLLDVLAALALVWGVALVFVIAPHASWFPWISPSLMDALQGLNKTAEVPARLISTLALLWFAVRLVPAGAAWLRGRAAGLVVLLGQHSLPVFCCSIPLAFLCRLGTHVDRGLAMQVAVNAGGILVLLAVAGISAWTGQTGRAQRPVAAPRRVVRPEAIPAPSQRLATAPRLRGTMSAAR